MKLARLEVFGSYRYGAVDEKSDMDLVLFSVDDVLYSKDVGEKIAPYLETLGCKIKQIISSASVPVLKFEY
jgi:DNA polymerase sigma